MTATTNPPREAWRVGRQLGRTLYIGDTLVGMMDTPELAQRVVEAMNRAAAEPEAPTPAKRSPTARVGDVLESKDGKRRTVERIDSEGCLYIRGENGGNGMIYPSCVNRYRVVRP